MMMAKSSCFVPHYLSPRGRFFPTHDRKKPMNTRDPMQLELPIKLQPQDEAFCTGLKVGFETSEKKHSRGEKRFYIPKLSDYDLNSALREYQKVN